MAVDGDDTSVIYEPAENERAVFVCAHGAGGHMRDRSMESVARALREPFVQSVARAEPKDEGPGMGVVRFNFPYKERGSRRPDPMPRLKQCMIAVIDHTRKELEPRTLIIGGRSFHVLKSSGRTDADVMKEVETLSAQWLNDVTSVTG